MSRCGMCHSEVPAWDGIAVAPKGVRLDSAPAIARQAAAIRHHAFETHNMPPNNLTQMTPEERQLLGAWTSAKPR
ncbi:putative membrane protein [Methylorubrum populi]|uniref:Putative membrane protein n=1 Tax=Methylorubrum populi TaxID=223967 RepID=A0A833J003_9HYPH|nr:putative membrane protein [Methylorubrum populi]